MSNSIPKRKYHIGYTTGVFDLFHIGHLNILKKAKEQCDILIVGVSTDEIVESYKHKKPVIPFEERIEIISALKYVDKAVPQTSMDKRAAWETLHFDALFHGDDWKGSSMYEKYQQDFQGTNVDIVFLPHTAGTSSTMLASVLHEALNQ